MAAVQRRFDPFGLPIGERGEKSVGSGFLAEKDDFILVR
jgi:hypothetical protein